MVSFCKSIFSFYFNFVNIFYFKRALKVAFGKYDNPNHPGEITHFQSFTAAMSGTIGLGNIAGVAVAISIGGPGAMLWMIITAFFGMTLKFVEVSLGHKYRVIHKDGTVSGGAIRYLSDGLGQLGYVKIGKVLAVFAICCIGGSFGGGNMFQANQAFQQIVEATGSQNSPFYNKGWLGGLIFAVIVGFIIIGGIKSIGKVTEKLVPLMAFCLHHILLVYNTIQFFFTSGETFGKIFMNAFSIDASVGGLIGSLIAGVKRAVFLTISGIGSAPIAYAAAKSDNHLNTGFMSLLSPVVDTIIVCSMTALLIVITGVYENDSGIQGVELTSKHFSLFFSWFPTILAIAITLFAISTLITLVLLWFAMLDILVWNWKN